MTPFILASILLLTPAAFDDASSAPVTPGKPVIVADASLQLPGLGRALDRVFPANRRLAVPDTPPLPMLGHRDVVGFQSGMWQLPSGMQPAAPLQALTSRGVVFNVAQISDLSRVGPATLPAGRSTRGYAEVSATVDLGRFTHREGDQVFVQVYGKRGTGAGDRLGDIQGTSNIDADDFVHVGEVWVETWVVPERLRLKVGRVDAATEFGASEHAGAFIAAPMGASPTIVGLPTYPQPATSVNLFWQPTAHVYAAGGVYDGRIAAPGAPGLPLFVITEGGVTWDGLPGRVAFGLWRHTGGLERLDSDATAAATGPYLVVDQSLWREKPDDPESRGVGVFLQYSTAGDSVSLVTKHVGAGLVWTGPIARRASDAIGFGVTRATLSAHAPDGAAGQELSMGPFYRLQVTDAVSLQPNLQYVRNPGGTMAGKGAFVWTLRIECGL